VLAINPDNPFKQPEDRLLFAKALDSFKAANTRNRATFTDFMNPQRCAVFLRQFEKMNAIAKAYGGYEDAERQMLGFFNASESHEDFPISRLQVSYNSRFSRGLTHRDYLGAVLGLGVDRGKIGDICLTDNGAFMFVSGEISGFITENLLQVGRTSVSVSLNPQPVVMDTNVGVQKRLTVASLRLDAVVGAALNLSRATAASLIDAERVFVNWMNEKKTHALSKGDIITVRQLGRIRLDDIVGTTKKDRQIILITIC